MEQFGDATASDGAGNDVFDASQYAFFGKDVAVEVELGGLNDEEEEATTAGFDEEFLFGRREESEELRSLSDVDDLVNTFSKLNKAVAGPRVTGIIGDRGSRESSSEAEWVQGEEPPNWFGQQVLDPDGIQDGKRWSSHPYSSGRLAESEPLYRTSSYPDQQQQLQQNHQQNSSEPILVPKSTYTSYPPPGGQSPQASPNQSHLNLPYHSAGHQIALSSPNLSPFSSSQFQYAGLPHGSPNQNVAQFPSGNNSRPPGQWVNNHSGLYPGDHPNQFNNVMQQHFPHQNRLIPPQMLPQLQPSHQHRLHNPVQPHLGMLPGMQPLLFNPHLSPSPQLATRYEALLGAGDLRDQRPRSAQRLSQNPQYPLQGFYINGQKYESDWLQCRSKYMTVDEIENIHRMQLAAIHSSDPYVDDYYHQAHLSKKSAGAKLKHHFCPTQLRDLPPHTRANSEPHAFLQVDALGRVPFSSIRRPRPLLEVESPNSSDSCASEQKVSEKPLEQEPMLAVRVTIEDGLCLLLDIDDIDRLLEFNQLLDGGNQLRHRRQALLEELAASLQLVDPLGKNGNTVGLAPEYDLVFLRIASLPKGRKLLAKYLRLIFPGSDLMRVVCMAIFRHLRFLFGGLQSDPGAADSANNLVRVVSMCVRRMDLRSLSACLAAVVCSSEQPPLRPLRSSAGSGASIMLLSILERATELSNDLKDVSSYQPGNRSLWKASFDEYFDLLVKYCINKYDTIMQSSLHDPSEAIKRELPMELLRASVPHTDDRQKKMLYDLSQRSLGGKGGSNGSHRF